MEVEKYGVNAYKFILPNNTYDRTGPNDCYASNPALASGLSDVSKCFYGNKNYFKRRVVQFSIFVDFPMAASFPHFLYGDDILRNYVDGLKPKKEAHDSFVIVEPVILLFI